MLTPYRLLPVDYCLMTTSYLLPSPYLYQLLYLFLLLLSIVPVDYSLLTTSDRLLNDYYSLPTTPYPILHTEYSLPDTSCFQFYIYTHFYFHTYIVSGLSSIHLPVLYPTSTFMSTLYQLLPVDYSLQTTPPPTATPYLYHCTIPP